jgi:Transposase
VFRARLTPANDVVVGWVRALPGPTAVVYEAGPTGFGLSRAFTTAGIRCEIVAPSKIQRPARDRVKTDARDAMHLARLLRLDEIVSVDVPTVQREAPRDLVRAREDVRGDLMRARHRVSNLLLRQGIVYYSGKAWTGTHLVWLRRQHFDAPGLQLAFDADHEAVLQAEPPQGLPHPRRDHEGQVGAGTGCRPSPRARRQSAIAPAVAGLHRPQERNRSSPTSRSPANWPAGAGPWPSWTTDQAGALVGHR